MSLIQDMLHIVRESKTPITKPQMIAELLTLPEYTNANLNRKSISDLLARLVKQKELARIGKLFCDTGGGTLVSVIQLLTERLETHGDMPVYGHMQFHGRYIEL